jgi:dihydrolipoamide dehydrogenase
MGSGAVARRVRLDLRRFGSDVTIVELFRGWCRSKTRAVSTELERSFKKQGIKVMTGTKVTSAKAGSDGVGPRLPNP